MFSHLRVKHDVAGKGSSTSANCSNWRLQWLTLAQSTQPLSRANPVSTKLAFWDWGVFVTVICSYVCMIVLLTANQNNSWQILMLATDCHREVSVLFSSVLVSTLWEMSGSSLSSPASLCLPAIWCCAGCVQCFFAVINSCLLCLETQELRGTDDLITIIIIIIILCGLVATRIIKCTLVISCRECKVAISKSSFKKLHQTM